MARSQGLTLDTLKYTLGKIETPFATYRCGDDGAALWLQCTLSAPDYTAAGVDEWRGRKWRVSLHSTHREVVGTAFAALLMALEHEARESFRWNGSAVFGPHIPLEALRSAAEVAPDRRENHP